MTRLEVERIINEYLTRSKGMNESEKVELLKELNLIKYKQRARATFGVRDMDQQFHYREIGYEYESKKPIVICLSGNGTEKPQQANGFCKIAEEFVALLFDGRSDIDLKDVDFIGCVYGKVTGKTICPAGGEFRQLYPDLVKYMKDFPLVSERRPSFANLENTEASELAKIVLLPRCVENNRKLPLDECLRRMRQVTFFTHCYGTVAMNMVVECFDKMLVLHGFSSEEIKQINDAMFHISFARLQYATRVPSVYFYSTGDAGIPTIPQVLKTLKGDPITEKLTKSGERTLSGRYYPDVENGGSESSILEFAYEGIAQNEDKYSYIDHCIGNLSRDYDWNIAMRTRGTVDAISQMMGWALSRSVENSIENYRSDVYIPQQSLGELREELMSIYQHYTNEELRFMESE